jgi:uncharacterized LabA/DUF88 family protein
MAFYPDERIAIFVDGANLHSTSKTLDFDIDFKRMLELFKGKGRLVAAKYYTAIFEGEDYSPIRPLIDWLNYNGYQVVTKPAKTFIDREGRSRIKGNMDIELALDMVELAEYVDHILLCSGDGDFQAAVKACQSKGTRVSVISSMKTKPPMLSDDLRRQANDIIELSDMETLIGRPRRDYADYGDD